MIKHLEKRLAEETNQAEKVHIHAQIKHWKSKLGIEDVVRGVGHLLVKRK